MAEELDSIQQAVEVLRPARRLRSQPNHGPLSQLGFVDPIPPVRPDFAKRCDPFAHVYPISPHDEVLVLLPEWVGEIVRIVF